MNCFGRYEPPFVFWNPVVVKRYTIFLRVIVLCLLFSSLCKAGLLSDLDNNGKVDLIDYRMLAKDWSKTDVNSVADVSGPEGIADKAVDWYDLNALNERYLKYAFLMTSHKSDDEKLYVWQSTDGLSWELRGDNPVYENPNLPHDVLPSFPDNKQNVVRDPSIMKYNGKYYIIYTTNNNIGCHYCGDQIGLASSDDLINWNHITDIDMTGAGNIIVSWAPEWFVDDDGSVHVFVSLNYKTYETHPTNQEFTEWTVPILVEGNWAGRSMIDAFVVKIDSTYYLWYKGPKDSMSRHNIEYATSLSLTEGYIMQETGNWAGFTNPPQGWNGIEGESLIQLDDGTWRIYFDDYVDNGIYYSESSDNFDSWTTKQLITTSESFIPAHPMVLREN